MRIRHALSAATAVAVLAAVALGCSGDSQDAAPTLPPVPTFATPADLTADEVCALLEPAAIETLVEADPGSLDLRPDGSGPPGCVFAFRVDGADTEITVTALRTDADLDGIVGFEAFSRALVDIEESEEAAFMFDIGDLGHQAVWMEGPDRRILVIQVAGRIVLVSGGSLTFGVGTRLGAVLVPAL